MKSSSRGSYLERSSDKNGHSFPNPTPEQEHCIPSFPVLSYDGISEGASEDDSGNGGQTGFHVEDFELSYDEGDRNGDGEPAVYESD